MDLPQLAQTVRSVRLPSARSELPLAAIAVAPCGVGWRGLCLQRGSHRPDEPSTAKRDEPRGVVLGHGTVSFRSPRRAHVGRYERPYTTRAAGLKTNSRLP